MDLIFLLIGLLAGLAIGFLLARSFASKNSSQEELNNSLLRVASLESTQTALKNELEATKLDLSNKNMLFQEESKASITWKSKYENIESRLVEQKKELEDLQLRFTKEFELVANRILEEKSEKFTKQNKENLGELLLPLNERIKEFQKRVEDTNVESEKRNVQLSEQLKLIRELNKEITEETKSLTKALKGDSKTQGNWGEMQLELLLEKAGLQKDIHYTKETNLKNEEGNNQRLDYIVNLPDGKHLILDSKVSLTAYARYFESEDEKEQTLLLKQHLDSIRGHIKLLSDKDYQNIHSINTPDYVLMFVANEPALTLALREDQNLFEKALEKNIVLVSSSTLLATLRTISYIWKQDLQNKNAEEIARQAASLYDKFVNFTEDLKKLGVQLKTATGTYYESMKKLSEGKDNLVRKTERLRELGVNPSKNLNPKLVDQSSEED